MQLLATLIIVAAQAAGKQSAAGVKYMLLDDRNIVSADAKLVLGAVVKHPANPMITEERDYEMRFDNMQPNVWYDPLYKGVDGVAGKWRAWYSAFTSCAQEKTSVPYCNNAPQTCGSQTDLAKNGAGRGAGFLYAESPDGIKWTKPSLNITDWKGSKANNLLENSGMTTGVFLDETTTDPSQRYKISTGTNGAGGIATSHDGLTWTNNKDLQNMTHARWDTPKNTVWDPIRKQWIIYVRSTPTEDGKAAKWGMRIQSYIHSLTDDFMGAWAPATPTGLNTSLNYQPDGLVVWPYEGIYIGIGNVFNPSSTVALSGAAIGQVNTVLGWSVDGRRWKWIKPNDSFMPLGKAGDFDACGTFGAKQDPLRTGANDDTLRFYYTGCNGPFFGSRGCALGMAHIQRDGWAGYKGGSVVTAPARVVAGVLRVSVDGGSSKTGIQIGIFGDDGMTIATCDPIKGKVVDHVVTWGGSSDLSHLLNGAFMLEWQIPDDATAFAFSM